MPVPEALMLFGEVGRRAERAVTLGQGAGAPGLALLLRPILVTYP